MKTRRVYAKKISYPAETWFSQFKRLAKEEHYHALLESGRGGRYSIMGLNPSARVEGKGTSLTIYPKEEQPFTMEGNILHLFKQWMNQFHVEHNSSLPDFQGGAIGFFSYDFVRNIEKIPSIAEDDLQTPDLYFLIFDDVFVFNHVESELWLITHALKDEEEKAVRRLTEYERRWKDKNLEEYTYKVYDRSSKETTYSQGELPFKQSVAKVQDYIAAGDVFQVNLSVRQSKPLVTPPFHIYEKLRELNPSPYMSYLETPEFQIVGGSPELLVKKKGSTVSTRPIAGTRSRGNTDEEDQLLAKELIENEKEKAEHVMLVDLERNDLGRVCEYGSVEVNEFMVIERYSHVMHIVSNVQGNLLEEKDAFDVVKAVFPGGTITGAPKVRTMEIIEELEPVRRGIYTGSIGWIGFDGEMELNIVIRTLLAKDGLAHVQAGAGIVIDSSPTAEYKECLKKAKALWKAKELSELELFGQ